MKQKLIAVLVLLAVAFGGGLYLGTHTPRGDVDPQDYIQTVFTPYESGIDNYLAFLDRTKQGGSVRVADYGFTEERVAKRSRGEMEALTTQRRTEKNGNT